MASENCRTAAQDARARCELTIVAGAHRGATFSLTQDMLLIGADEACDVWLSDAGLASRHVAVMADDRGVAIRALEGPVSVNGQPLQGSARVELAPGSEIALGDTGVRLRVAGDRGACRGDLLSRPDEQGPSDGEQGVSQAQQRSRTGEQADGPGKQGSGRDRTSRRKPTRSRAVAASMLVGVGILAVGVATQKLRPARAATAVPAMSAEAPMSDAELLEQVREAFRTNGYQVEAATVGPKSVRIENLDASNERVRRAAEQVRADIPQLKALSFASPDDADPPSDPPFYENAPAGHLTISVNEDTAYLSAHDGGRYFAGSVLPSGYTVRRITNRAVQVERDGQISWFRF
jgi:Inner membrane component of T3SS, cytoplasmic domain